MTKSVLFGVVSALFIPAAALAQQGSTSGMDARQAMAAQDRSRLTGPEWWVHEGATRAEGRLDEPRPGVQGRAAPVTRAAVREEVLRAMESGELERQKWGGPN